MPIIQNYNTYLNNLFDLLGRYLISDLETLINEIPARPKGGVGYPALQTIIAGMELLGLVLSGKTGSQAFKFYWDNYLSRSFPQYNINGLFSIFSRVMRNGTAHFFLVKTGVTVSKDGNNHLSPIDYSGKNFLNVDLLKLHEHFINTYNGIKNDLLNNNISLDVQAGCNILQKQMNEADYIVTEFLKINFPGTVGYHPIDITPASIGFSGPTAIELGNNNSTVSGTVTSSQSDAQKEPGDIR